MSDPEPRWPHPRHRDGGADEIPLPDVPGRLWLCGKHAIGPNAEAALAHLHLDAVVCLNERHELLGRYPDYVRWLEANNPERVIWFPIHDLSSPDLATMMPVYEQALGRLRSGEGLLVHCGAGIGRAGTAAVALCMLLGMSRDEALLHVRAHRPMAGPEVGAQMNLINELDEHLQSETTQ